MSDMIVKLFYAFLFVLASAMWIYLGFVWLVAILGGGNFQ